MLYDTQCISPDGKWEIKCALISNQSKLKLVKYIKMNLFEYNSFKKDIF